MNLHRNVIRALLSAALLFVVKPTLAAGAPEPISLRASTGVVVSAIVYEAEAPKAVILLFHQASSSKDEYAKIAPRLVAEGYTALAIDQRAGGSLFGKNETAARLKRASSFEGALPDLEGALTWVLAPTEN